MIALWVEKESAENHSPHVTGTSPCDGTTDATDRIPGAGRGLIDVRKAVRLRPSPVALFAYRSFGRHSAFSRGFLSKGSRDRRRQWKCLRRLW
jgi:hypothetical protein